MTDTLLDLVNRAGFDLDPHEFSGRFREQMEAFYRLVVEKIYFDNDKAFKDGQEYERGECADACAAIAKQYGDAAGGHAAERCEAAIRARTNN